MQRQRKTKHTTQNKCKKTRQGKTRQQSHTREDNIGKPPDKARKDKIRQETKMK